MKNRIDRVSERMKAQGLEQMIVSDSKSIWYLTGVDVEPMERMFAFLIRTDGHHVFFLNRLFNVADTGFEEVWFSDTDDSIGLMAEHVDAGKPLGIDKEWKAGFLIPLTERCPGLRVKLASDCVDDCRAVKDEEEQARMREASRINDEVNRLASEYVKEGMTERQVAAFIDAEFRKRGCDGNSFSSIVSFGANAADPHHEPDDTVLKAGECVLIDMGCKKNRYCSDMTRTFFCKRADPEQARIHDLVREANERAESIIRPGVRFCDIDAAARDYITAAGYGEYFNHRLGHFIGQTDHEKGDVSSANTRTAEPGMIFSIEPGIYLPGKFGVRVEDLVMVTEDGCELLNREDKKWRIVG
ncbi:MAG: aminopeptidase P family protein [Clostridia bacterium]|nr:aminopeptidase P family protein [Clostridia bacterium]